MVCSHISTSTEYKQDHSSGPELVSLKWKERQCYFPQIQMSYRLLINVSRTTEARVPRACALQREATTMRSSC